MNEQEEGWKEGKQEKEGRKERQVDEGMSGWMAELVHGGMVGGRMDGWVGE